jgi:hypothetical protein
VHTPAPFIRTNTLYQRMYPLQAQGDVDNKCRYRRPFPQFLRGLSAPTKSYSLPYASFTSFSSQLPERPRRGRRGRSWTLTRSVRYVSKGT